MTHTECRLYEAHKSYKAIYKNLTTKTSTHLRTGSFPFIFTPFATGTRYFKGSNLNYKNTTSGLLPKETKLPTSWSGSTKPTEVMCRWIL